MTSSTYEGSSRFEKPLSSDAIDPLIAPMISEDDESTLR